MAENVRLEEVNVTPSNPAMPRTPLDTRQAHGLLMTHAVNGIRPVPLASSIRGFNFGARTMEHSRMLADNISSTIEEIRPFIQQARVRPEISFGSLLNIPRRQPQTRANPPPSTDSYVIDLEDPPTAGDSTQNSQARDHHRQTSTDNNISSNVRETTSNEGRSNGEEESTETMQISPDTRALLKTLQKYIPFFSILIVKGIYDHRVRILNFIVLFATFNHANNVLKREIAKQQNRSWMALLTITCCIVACIVFITFDFEMRIFSPYAEPLTVWELLWSVLVTDFVLKLVTIVCKVILTCLPTQILALRKRGKYYLMVEATSQLYRCVAPVQPWLYYLFEAYQGPEKVLGVALSTLYTVSKANDLLSRVELFCTAVWKLLQNVNLGVSPSKEQLLASGGICAICHEEYSMPVRLHCKHIFCETCVSTWLDRERSCPLCRAAITDDPIYRDGHTTYFVQLY